MHLNHRAKWKLSLWFSDQGQITSSDVFQTVKWMQRCCALESRSWSQKDARASPAAIPPVSIRKRCQKSPSATDKQCSTISDHKHQLIKTVSVFQSVWAWCFELIKGVYVLTDFDQDIFYCCQGCHREAPRKLVMNESSLFHFWWVKVDNKLRVSP